DNGIRHLELEFLTDWFVDGTRKVESDGRKRRLLEASAALAAKHIKVGDFYNTPARMPRLVDAFAALCKEAEDYGATIGFDIMGFIAAVEKTGYSSPWAVEVFSKELVEWPLDDLNTRAYETSMAQFEE